MPSTPKKQPCPTRGRGWNAPRKGQRGMRPREDHFDRTGEVPPRHLTCAIDGCHDPMIQDPVFRSQFVTRLCEYHSGLYTRNGAPTQDDVPWPEFFRLRDTIRTQLGRVEASPVVERAMSAINATHGRCHARAAEKEAAGKPIPLYLDLGRRQAVTADPRAILEHHIAFEIMLRRGHWEPMPGYPRHADMTWLRCIRKAWPYGKRSKTDRPRVAPHGAYLLREMLEPGLRQIVGRTDYALREADLQGRKWLKRDDALGWFQDQLQSS